MSSLFEDLKQGLEEAIEYEKGKGKAGVKTYSITPVKEYSGKEIREIRMKAGMTQQFLLPTWGCQRKLLRLGNQAEHILQVRYFVYLIF